MNRLFIVCFGLLLGGCSGMVHSINESLVSLTDRFTEEDNSQPANELIPLETGLNIETLWKARIGVGSGGQYINLVPVVWDDKIFVADRDGLVEVRKVTSGEVVWTVESDLLISGGPGLGRNSVLLGTSNAEVVALDKDDGSALWTAKVSSEVFAIPQYRDGIVVIRTIDGKLLGLDEQTGIQLWSYERTVPALSLRGTSSPIIVDDMVISGFANGKLVALQLSSGKPIWEVSIAEPRGRSELERMVDLDADPVELNGVVYTTGFQGGVAAVSVIDGDLLWRREEISSYAGIALNWRYVFLTDDDSDIWVFDQENGAALWRQPDLHNRKVTAPALYKDTVLVGDFEGYIHWFAQEDGRQLHRLLIDRDGIKAPPVVVDNVIYVYGKGGRLVAMTVE